MRVATLLVAVGIGTTSAQDCGSAVSTIGSCYDAFVPYHPACADSYGALGYTCVDGYCSTVDPESHSDGELSHISTNHLRRSPPPHMDSRWTIHVVQYCHFPHTHTFAAFMLGPEVFTSAAPVTPRSSGTERAHADSDASFS
jgi:hypothetical protein